MSLSCFLWLKLPDAHAQRPYVLSSFPVSGATQLPCHTFIKASLYFPFESKILDPLTFRTEAVHLFAADEPGRWVEADLVYQPEWNYLTLRPREVLRPRTTYVFEITPGLIDGRGFSFFPFRLEFQTGDCERLPEDSLLALTPAEPLPEPEPVLALATFEAEWAADSLQLYWTTGRNWPPGELRLMHRANGQASQPLAVVEISEEQWRRKRFSYWHIDPPWGSNSYRLEFLPSGGERLAMDSMDIFRPRLHLIRKQIPPQATLSFEVWSERETTMAFILKTKGGKILRRKAGKVKAGRQLIHIPLKELPPGTYLVQFRTPHLSLVETIEILSP